MLTAAFSASRRSLFLLGALAGVMAGSLGLSGCAGVVGAPGSGTGSTGSLAISNVQSASATNSSVQLSWATNEPSTSAIDYGTTSAYGASTPVSAAMVTAHQMTLTSLAHSTTYHFRVRSTTSSDSATSPDQTFTTLGGSNTAPSVQVTSPAAGATLSGTVNLTAAASDDGTVTSVQFVVDAHRVGPELKAVPYLYVLDTTSLSKGAHSISAIATDNQSQSTTSATVSVNVDNTTKDTTPPTVSITSPANGAKVAGVVAVTATAADNVGVANLQFEIDGANVGSPDAAAPYAYSWDTSKSSNGSHTLKAIAKDGAGNATTSAVVTVTVNNSTVDKTPPTVAITSPAASVTLSGTVNVTATASDNIGVTSVQFQVDGANAGTSDASAPYAFVWDTTKIANGVHKLDAIAKDAAGNATTSAVVSVTVNNTQAKNFSISGTVSGPGASGTTVTLTGGSVAATTTSASGAYSFTGLATGSYTVTVTHTGFTFTPASLSTTIGAANVTGLNFTSTAVSTPTFSISGTISGTGGPGSTVTLTGASNATTTANGAGAYTFTGLAKGSYAVTASHTGFTFSPASLTESINTANITGANFTSTAVPPQTFSISGTVSGAGASGTTLTLSGAGSATTTTNASGAFSFTGLAKGTYAVTPGHTGFTFLPTSQSATISTANVTGVNFASTAAPTTFSISGTITPTSGGSGATVLLSGAAGATATTNASGAYTFTGLANGNYTVTPSSSSFTFTPASQAAAISGANDTGVNFTAAAKTPPSVKLTWNPSTSTVVGYYVYRSTSNGSGYVKLNSSLVPSTSYTDATVQSGITYFYVTTAVDSSGQESANSNQATAVIP
jgi:hypothetical protein